MENSLKISINDVSIEPITNLNDSSYTFSFSGILRNGNSQTSETSVHLAFYDVFDRVIQISTIDIGNMNMNELVPVKLNEEISSSSIGFILYSESDKFYTDFIDVEIPAPQLRTNFSYYLWFQVK